MNDIKISADESPQCDDMSMDTDIDAVVAHMSPLERDGYLAWCGECRDRTIAAMEAEAMGAVTPAVFNCDELPF